MQELSKLFSSSQTLWRLYNKFTTWIFNFIRQTLITPNINNFTVNACSKSTIKELFLVVYLLMTLSGYLTSRLRCASKKIFHETIFRQSSFSIVWKWNKQRNLSSRYQRCFKSSQPTITCLKLTIETLEQGMKYVQS